MIDYDKLARSLRNYRVKKVNGNIYTISRRNVASKIGINHNTLKRIEDGGACDLDTFSKICTFLGSQMDEFSKQ